MNHRKARAYGALIAACLSAPVVARGNEYFGTVLYPLNSFESVTDVNDFNALTPGGIGAGDGTPIGGSLNALVWNDSTGFTDLNPTAAGITYSSAQGAGGNQEVGYAYGQVATDNNFHAYLWTGTAASAVDLNPAGAVSSAAYATDGSNQVGYAANAFGIDTAKLWKGSASTALNLFVGGTLTSSIAYGVGGGQEVGVGSSLVVAGNALLWSGAPAVATNLNPSQLDINDSTALNADGSSQVGYGSGPDTGVDNNGNPLTHALLWNGSASSAVDLNPSGLGVFESVATAVSGNVQAGYGYLTSGYGNALAWNGSARSAVNLQNNLPLLGSWTDSYALNVDSSGNVYGSASGTYNGSTGQFAIEWQSVPAVTWYNSHSGDGVTWDVGVNENWDNGTSFSTYANGSAVTFNDDNNGAYTVVLASTVDPYAVTFANNDSNYSISGPGGITGTGALVVEGSATVVLATSNSYTGGTDVLSGRLVIAGQQALPARQAVDIGSNTSGGTLQLTTVRGSYSVSSLSISLEGSLDLESNELTIFYSAVADPVTAIQAYLADGYSAGWGGGQIYSSSVAYENSTQKALIYGVGYADGADGLTSLFFGQLEILPTLVGDAKLQGNVVFGDFQLLAQYFGKANTSWDEGDFTYNGSTTFGDFQLLAQNFGATATNLTASELASINQFAAIGGEAFVPDAGGGYSLVAVPEPAAALLAIPALAALAMRRRARHGM